MRTRAVSWVVNVWSISSISESQDAFPMNNSLDKFHIILYKNDMEKLSEMEHTALGILIHHGGSLLVSSIPDKNENTALGMEPGIRVYQKLDKRGLVVLTEEDPIEINGEEFTFTSSAEITDEGREAYFQS